MLLRQKKEMHWDVPMMGGDAANNTDLVKIAGKDAAKGYFFISPPSAHDFDTPEAKDFFSRYKAQYNSLPSSVWSVLAGDAFKVIVAALQAGTDANPEAVAKYLKKDLKEYPGLTGKLGFNEKGDRIGDLYKVYEVDGNGGFRSKVFGSREDAFREPQKFRLLFLGTVTGFPGRRASVSGASDTAGRGQKVPGSGVPLPSASILYQTS